MELDRAALYDTHRSEIKAFRAKSKKQPSARQHQCTNHNLKDDGSYRAITETGTDPGAQ